MALGIDFGTVASGDGDTLFAAFTKINNMFSTTTKLGNGDLTINDVRVGRGNGNQLGSTAIGIESSNSSSSISYDNTSVGYQTLKNNVNGASNTAIGAYALSKTTSSNNVGLGLYAGYNNISGIDNISIGVGANYNPTNLDNTIVIGRNVDASASNQTIIGNGSTISGRIFGEMIIGSNGGITVGKGAGSNNYGSTAIGQDALTNSTGGDNTALGWSALNASMSGNSNTALGSNAMRFATGSTLNGNTAVGAVTLKNSTGENNTAVGIGALQDNQGGLRNTAVGAYPMEKNISGSYNTAFGNAALYFNQSGSYNTALGSDALSQGTAYSYSTGLGYNAQVDGSNQIQLGSGTTTCYTYGVVQNRSDLRDKTEVRDTVLGLDFINELRPVDYKWDMREDYRDDKPSQLALDATKEEKEAHKILTDAWLESCKLENITHDGTHTRNRYHHGLIAQEVQDVIEASGVDFGGFQDHKVNGGGDVLSIGYTELIAPMIKAIQELTARINVLEGN